MSTYAAIGADKGEPMIFSTQGVHPRERLSYWREVATRGYVEHEFRAEDGLTFSGSVSIATLPGIGISSFEADAAHVTRTEKSAARADSSDLLLGLHRSGTLVISQDGREGVIEHRGMYLIDPIRPFAISLRERCSNIVVKIPRGMVEARLGNSADLTARAIGPATGIASLAMGFIELLPQQAEALDDVTGMTVAEQLLDLTALAFSSSLDGRATALSAPKAVALLRIKATVERLMIEPGLKPDRIAAEAGVSVRYANALLAEEGWSIERYLNERRLERCRGALEDLAQTHRSIGEIAFHWGFSDLSHFGRRFKARYGFSPTDYRRDALRRGAGAPAPAVASAVVTM
jgi:AraC-like DNA-binding protein